MKQCVLALMYLCLLFRLIMSCGRGGTESGSLERTPIPIPTPFGEPEFASGTVLFQDWPR